MKRSMWTVIAVMVVGCASETKESAPMVATDPLLTVSASSGAVYKGHAMTVVVNPVVGLVPEHVTVAASVSQGSASLALSITVPHSAIFTGAINVPVGVPMADQMDLAGIEVDQTYAKAGQLDLNFANGTVTGTATADGTTYTFAGKYAVACCSPNADPESGGVGGGPSGGTCSFDDDWSTSFCQQFISVRP